MSDVLSQSEIDELLKSLTQGDFAEEEETEESEEIKFKKYDFRTANKFTKEQVRTFNNVYSTFTHLLSTYLSGTLRTTCQVDVVSAEELTYSEYTNSLQPPIILAIVDMPPLDGSTLIEISPSIAYGILNRLLGGRGGDLETSKTFTDIDIALIERVLQQMLKQVDAAWTRIVKVKSRLNRIETSPQFAQIVAYNEPTVIITISVKIGDEVDGFINICIPYAAIEPINSNMESSMWISSKKIKYDPENEVNIREKLKKAKFDVVADFTSMPVSINDIVSLEVGDVLKLDHRVEDGLWVKIAGKPKFRGKLGVFENKYAIKLSEKIEEDREDE